MKSYLVSSVVKEASGFQRSLNLGYLAITKKDRWDRNDNNNQCNSDLSFLLEG